MLYTHARTYIKDVIALAQKSGETFNTFLPGCLQTIKTCLNPNVQKCVKIGWRDIALLQLDMILEQPKSSGGNKKNPGWLGYTGDYTTQLYRDYNKPL